MRSCQIIFDQDVPLSFEGFLFNEYRQARKQPLEEYHFFHLKIGDLSYARFNLFISEKEAYSPARAPFGSLEFHQDITFDELDFFLKEILKYCIINKIKTLKIISYPYCYSPVQSQLLTYIFISNGFNIKVTDLNFHIVVEKPFVDLLHLSEKRRLKKCLDKKFRKEIGKGEHTKEVFKLIKDSRERKGFPISMKEDELPELFKDFPDDYWIFTVWDDNKLVASSIGVRVYSEILYYFLPADHPDYRQYSPMVLLLNNMYNFCKENKFKILDLGIATSAGIPNEGLIRFKENIGGEPSLKFTFEKVF